jgi:hypothetical protein
LSVQLGDEPNSCSEAASNSVLQLNTLVAVIGALSVSSTLAPVLSNCAAVIAGAGELTHETVIEMVAVAVSGAPLLPLPKSFTDRVSAGTSEEGGMEN